MSPCLVAEKADAYLTQSIPLVALVRGGSEVSQFRAAVVGCPALEETDSHGVTQARTPSEQELPLTLATGYTCEPHLAHPWQPHLALTCWHVQTLTPLILSPAPVVISPPGYASASHWKVYIVARGAQPLVLCDGTTLPEP